MPLKPVLDKCVMFEITRANLTTVSFGIPSAVTENNKVVFA